MKKEEMNKERAAKNIRTAVAMYHAAAALNVEFEKAMRGTEEESVRILPFHLSIGILQVFGIETALKALIRRQGKNPPNIHNLRKLYDMLAPQTQKSISEKSAAIDIRVKGTAMSILVEGVMEEHQNSFQEWRYREDEKYLPVVTGVLPGTLQAVIQTYQEKYGAEDSREEENQGTQKPQPGMQTRAIEYYKNVLIQRP